MLAEIATHVRRGAAAAINDSGTGIPHDIAARVNAAIADVAARVEAANEPVADLAFATAYRIVRSREDEDETEGL